jgi:hypothetical protein
VARVCKENGVFLRVGIYDNIPFFDTIEDAPGSAFGEYKNEEVLTYPKAMELKENKRVVSEKMVVEDYTRLIPEEVREYGENYDYVKLYQNWVTGKLRLGCHSIMDSAIVLPDGDVPVCQHLPTRLGNVNRGGLDEAFNSASSNKVQKYHSQNCNQCWVAYHRKYDIVLYRTFEKYFGRWASTKLLGYYKWDSDERV